jgi:hypothetical protein
LKRQKLFPERPSCLFSFVVWVSDISNSQAKETYQLHSNQEIVLVLNQEFENLLRQDMLFRAHSVVGMGENSGLEDQCQV